MTIKLYWADFYEQMEKMNMEDDYNGFEKVLVFMFKTQFNVNQIEIDWMD
jgi:hypothetical protein